MQTPLLFRSPVITNKVDMARWTFFCITIQFFEKKTQFYLIYDFLFSQPRKQENYDENIKSDRNNPDVIYPVRKTPFL